MVTTRPRWSEVLRDPPACLKLLYEAETDDETLSAVRFSCMADGNYHITSTRFGITRRWEGTLERRDIVSLCRALERADLLNQPSLPTKTPEGRVLSVGHPLEVITVRAKRSEVGGALGEIFNDLDGRIRDLTAGVVDMAPRDPTRKLEL